MDYPVSNEVYNLLSMLTNKLQALEAYDKYGKDMDSAGRDALKRITTDDRAHIELLIDALEARLCTRRSGRRRLHHARQVRVAQGYLFSR